MEKDLMSKVRLTSVSASWRKAKDWGDGKDLLAKLRWKDLRSDASKVGGRNSLCSGRR
jgi:hypothetical protein